MKRKLIWLIFIFFLIPLRGKSITKENYFSYKFSNQIQKIANEGSTEDKYPSSMPNISSSEDFNCETIFLNSDGSEKELKKILKNIYIILRVLAIVIAIALSGLDFIKALGKADNEIFKKMFFKLIKRLVIAVLIMFLPNLLELIFEIFGLYDLSNCGIG